MAQDYADIYIRYIELYEKISYDPLAVNLMKGFAAWAGEYVVAVVDADNERITKAEKALARSVAELKKYCNDSLQVDMSPLPDEAGGWCIHLVQRLFKKNFG